ncbi:MAG: hypothetical protein KF773_16850 [Deltaproteobacteria bacterium]|nr:hypothetical protein [Deltaproteobacteria bacterium]
MDDGDAKLNRYFIEDCLKVAIKKLNRGTDVVEYSVVRDTAGLAGMVDIGRVILERIVQSAVFVADVSLINPKLTRREGERPTPNPNVMFELGFAYAKGEDAIIAVFNTASGDVVELPFDVRPKRMLTYHAACHADREVAKPKLVAALLDALKLCLKDTEDTKITRNSVVADAIVEARLLASEITDWPDAPALMQTIEHITQKLETAITKDVLTQPRKNLLWSALKAFRAASQLAPTDENWSLMKQHVESAATYVDFLGDDFSPDEETLKGWLAQLRQAPSELRKVLDVLEAEVAAEGSVENKLVAELESHTWTVRRIALHGPDSRHPKFGEALGPLSRKLRKAALVLAGKQRLAACELREMCAELETLVARYYPPPSVALDAS